MAARNYLHSFFRFPKPFFYDHFIYSDYFDGLACRPVAGDDSNRAGLQSKGIGYQRFNGGIGLAFLRGRADPQFQAIAEPASHGGACRTRDNLYLYPDHWGHF